LQRNRRGRLGEEIAVAYLKLQSLSILQRNLRVAQVEVDIVAREGACLLLVEVKLRQNGLQRARESLGRIQEERLLRAARALLGRHLWAEAVRIDVIGIDVDDRSGSMRLEHLRGVLPR
jgi:putative endonuclease